MRKISKKDQDPRQVEWDGAALAALDEKKSPHFTVGTFIVMAGRGRGEIISISHDGTALSIRWDDDSMSIIKPMALNR